MTKRQEVFEKIADEQRQKVRIFLEITEFLQKSFKKGKLDKEFFQDSIPHIANSLNHLSPSDLEESLQIYKDSVKALKKGEQLTHKTHLIFLMKIQPHDTARVSFQELHFEGIIDHECFETLIETIVNKSKKNVEYAAEKAVAKLYSLIDLLSEKSIKGPLSIADVTAIDLIKCTIAREDGISEEEISMNSIHKDVKAFLTYKAVKEFNKITLEKKENIK